MIAHNALYGAISAAALVTMTCWIYYPTISSPAYFDDLQVLGENLSEVRPPRIEAVLSPQSRPLLMLWYWVVAGAGGGSVAVLRLAGLFVHFMNAALIFMLASRVMSVVSRSHAGSDIRLEQGNFLPFSLAAVWLVHPVAMQAVCSISQQAELLMTACFTMYLLLIVSKGFAREWLRIVLLHATLLAGMYFKIVMVAAVPAGILLDAIAKPGGIRSAFRENWWVHAPPLVACVVLVVSVTPSLLRAEGGVGFGGDAPAPAIYLMTSARSIANYLRLVVLPLDLAIDRGPNWIENVSVAAPYLGCILTYLCIAVWLWRKSSSVPLSRGRFAAWLMLMPLIILAPTSSIVPTADPFFEHRIYLAFAFVAWLLLYALSCLLPFAVQSPTRRIALASSIVCLVVVLFCARARIRSFDFRDRQTIWCTALRVDPSNSRAAQNWVVATQESGTNMSLATELQELIVYARATGHDVDALEHQLAKDLLRQGQAAMAAKVLHRVTSRLPTSERLLTNRQRREFGERWFDLAIALYQLSRPSDALLALERTLEVSPTDPVVFQLQGDLYQEVGMQSKAMESRATAQQLWGSIDHQ